MDFIEANALSGTQKRYTSQSLFGTAADVVSVTPGRLMHLTVVSISGSALYVFVVDKNTTVAANDRGIWYQRLPANTVSVFDFTPVGGLVVASGIAIAISTGLPLLTFNGSSVALATAFYTAQ
jgi:hypothetical protein